MVFTHLAYILNFPEYLHHMESPCEAKTRQLHNHVWWQTKQKHSPNHKNDKACLFPSLWGDCCLYQWATAVSLPIIVLTSHCHSCLLNKNNSHIQSSHCPYFLTAPNLEQNHIFLPLPQNRLTQIQILKQAPLKYPLLRCPHPQFHVVAVFYCMGQ